MTERPLRFATFLAPRVLPAYRFIADYVGRTLGVPTELVVGTHFRQFARGEVDVGFICGLPYIDLMRENPAPVELLAAPVLQGKRYAGKPVYYSDVIVRRDTPYTAFSDLAGCAWSYNDRDSHSGYGVTRYKLVQMGRTSGFFGKVVEAGFHQESIRLVCSGRVDASAIDSQVLALALRDHPSLAFQLRVIDTLGPSTIQPVVASRQLRDSLKYDISRVLIEMAEDPIAQQRLAECLFERFVRVSDSDYDDLRAMLVAAEQADFLVLR